MNTFEIDNKRYTESILKTLSESKNRINNEGAKEILSSLLMYETLKKYKEHQKPMNLLLYGKSGSGKTFLVEQYILNNTNSLYYYVLPFKYLVYEPLQMFSNDTYKLIDYLRIICIQLIWCIIFYIISRFILRKGVEHFSNVGG